MLAAIQLSPGVEPEGAAALRTEVRAFVREMKDRGLMPEKPAKFGLGFSAEISREIGRRGWIGMTWPKAYDGQERSALERYVVTEELLSAAVPVSAHWFGDRQSGPVFLKFGNETQRQAYLPGIARGELFFCIGMSEPNSGSDLASLQSRAEQTPQGWRVSGLKLWTTNAHRAHHMITLLRTAPAGENRHAGLSQFIVDLSLPGVTVRPVINMAGEHDFNEVFFDDVDLPPDALIGAEGAGWSQVSAELAYERSGPERWLSAFRLFSSVTERLGETAGDATRADIGRLAAHLVSLRSISLSIAAALERGETPNVQAAIAKDLGTRFEQEMVRTLRNIILRERLDDDPVLAGLLASGQLYAPAFTIRGGATEILRGVIARGLGLR